MLIAGWLGGRLAGCVTLDLDSPPNQAHRAEVQMLLVDPATRRRGLARAMIRRLEVEATHQRRTLLTLATTTGDNTAGETGAGDTRVETTGIGKTVGCGETDAAETNAGNADARDAGANAAAALFRGMGWTEAGRIPDTTGAADGVSIRIALRNKRASTVLSVLIRGAAARSPRPM